MGNGQCRVCQHSGTHTQPHCSAEKSRAWTMLAYTECVLILKQPQHLYRYFELQNSAEVATLMVKASFFWGLWCHKKATCKAVASLKTTGQAGKQKALCEPLVRGA